MSLSAHPFFTHTRLGHLFSALLFIVYAGSILVLVVLLLSWSGLASPLVLVGCTLLLAGLLHPVRRGVQKLINRRFGV
jgi:uncharacterized membrane protein